MHLQHLAQKLPDRPDFHEPHRRLHDLGPYDHLHRVFRLCEVHIFRNIKKSLVPETVKQKMRSLVCLEHPNWDETLISIENEGGIAGASMYHDLNI